MALQKPLGQETGSLEMAIDVAGEDETAQRTAFAPTPEDLETGVRGRGPIEIEAVAEESPGLSGSRWNQTGLEISSNRRP